MLESGKISARQLFFTICCFTLSSTLITSFIFHILDTDTWMGYLAGTLLALPFIAVYGALAKRFPDKNLFQINTAVFGKVLGFLISCGYLWFFLSLSALNMVDVVGLVGITLMPETPPLVLLMLLLFVSAWSVRYGVESVTRYSASFVYTFFFITLLSVVFTLDQMSLSRFLPFFSMPASQYWQGTHTAMTIPLGECVVILMLTPAVRDRKKLGKSIFFGFILGALFLLVTILRDTAILGNVASLFTIPSYESFRVVSLSQSISRIDILFAITLIVLIYYKMTILYYASTLGVAQLLGMKNYRSIVGFVGVFLAVYSMTITANVIDHMGIALTFVPFIWFVFEYFLPAAALIIVLVKDRVAKGKTAQKAEAAV